MAPKSEQTSRPSVDELMPKEINSEAADSDYGSLEERTDSDEDNCSTKPTTEEGNKNQVKETVETQTESDPITQEANVIARDIFNMTYPKDPTVSLPRHKSPYTKTVLRLVNEILGKHSSVYKSIVRTMKMSDNINYEIDLNIMCDELFKGDTVTWGRILALYALCFEIARHCCEKKESRLTGLLVCDSIGHYIGEKAEKWIRQEGGWSSLESAFPPKDAMEQKVWRGLLMTGLGLGVLATVIKAVR